MDKNQLKRTSKLITDSKTDNSKVRHINDFIKNNFSKPFFCDSIIYLLNQNIYDLDLNNRKEMLNQTPIEKLSIKQKEYYALNLLNIPILNYDFKDLNIESYNSFVYYVMKKLDLKVLNLDLIYEYNDKKMDRIYSVCELSKEDIKNKEVMEGNIVISLFQYNLFESVLIPSIDKIKKNNIESLTFLVDKIDTYFLNTLQLEDFDFFKNNNGLHYKNLIIFTQKLREIIQQQDNSFNKKNELLINNEKDNLSSLICYLFEKHILNLPIEKDFINSDSIDNLNKQITFDYFDDFFGRLVISNRYEFLIESSFNEIYFKKIDEYINFTSNLLSFANHNFNNFIPKLSEFVGNYNNNIVSEILPVIIDKFDNFENKNNLKSFLKFIFEKKDFDLTSYCNSFIENNDNGKIAEFFLTLTHNDEHKEETKRVFKKKF